MYKKILTLILALAMILCLVPTYAFAEGDFVMTVLDSEGNQLSGTDSRISISGNTLTIKGSDLTVTYDSTSAFDTIVPDECDLVIESEGKVTLEGINNGTSSPYFAANSITINKGDVEFDVHEDEDIYIGMMCATFTMNGGTFTSDSNVEDICILYANDIVVNGGTMNFTGTGDYMSAMYVLMDDENTKGTFTLNDGTIDVNYTGVSSQTIFVENLATIKGGTFNSTSAYGTCMYGVDISGGTLNSTATAVDSFALETNRGEISEGVVNLNSEGIAAVLVYELVDVGESSPEPFKIHDCEFTAIATGEDSFGMASSYGFDFSNVTLYSTGTLAAIATGNDPECEINFFSYGSFNFSGTTTVGSDMKLYGSDEAGVPAEDLEMTLTDCDIAFTYFVFEVNAVAFGIDESTPALTVANNIYKITEGAEQTWTKGSDEDASFTSNANYGKFKAVLVDDEEVDKDNYTVKEGSTIVNLKAPFLETLSAGKHMLEIASTNGSAKTSFTIVEPVAPAPNPDPAPAPKPEPTPEPTPAQEPEEIANTGEASMSTFAAISVLAATAFYTSIALRKGKEFE